MAMTERARHGIMGSALTAALALSGAALANDPEYDQSQQQRQQQQSQQQPRQQPQQSTSTPGEQAGPASGKDASATPGDRETVKELQRELSRRGFYQGRIDGIHGPKTASALRNFQSQNGLESTGELDQKTADALGLGMERQPVSGSGSTATPGGNVQQSAGQQGGAASAGPNEIMLSNLGNEQIKLIQQRLKELGFYRGSVDGVIGPQTRGALQRFFQRQAELAVQGKVTEPTMSALGVESTTRQPVGGSEQSPQPSAE